MIPKRIDLDITPDQVLEYKEGNSIMNIKNGLICLLIVAILSLCKFNSVAAAPVSKQTTNVHSNYAVYVNGKQQTYLEAYLGDATAITIGVGQSIYLSGILDLSPNFSPGNGIPNAMANIQSMNSDGKTWNTSLLV